MYLPRVSYLLNIHCRPCLWISHAGIQRTDHEVSLNPLTVRTYGCEIRVVEVL